VYGMPREPKHPSGAAKVVTVRLSPAHVARLDELRGGKLSRSEVIARLLEKGNGFSGAHPAVSGAPPEPEHPQPLVHVLAPEAPAEVPNGRSTCEHLPIRRRTIAGGMVRCDACGMVRGAGGIWR